MLALILAMALAAADDGGLLSAEWSSDWQVQEAAFSCPSRPESLGADLDPGQVFNCQPDPEYSACIVVAVPIRARPDAAMDVIQDIEGNARFFPSYRFELDGQGPITAGREYSSGARQAKRIARYRFTAVAPDRMAGELVDGGGVFARFAYDHRVRPWEGGSVSAERVQWRLAGGPLGAALNLLGVRKKVARIDCGAHHALDALMTGSDLAAPTGPGSQAPFITEDKGGFRMVWWEPDGDTHRLMTAWGDGQTWAEPVPISAGGSYFVNWADTPTLARGPGAMWLATWPEKVEGGPYAYGVAAALSADDAQTWRPLGLLHDDGTATEHGFVSLLPDADGVQVFWLDGRATVDGGAMTLRTVHIAPDGEMSESVRLDERVCDCCGTGATTVDGQPLIVYRDRSGSEVRDTSAVRRDASGWQPPEPVSSPGWQVPGCPVNGPRVAANGRHVAVVEFTAVGEQSVLLNRSSDGGQSWLEPVPVAGPATKGRVDIRPFEDGFLVMWMDAISDEEAMVRARRVGVDGRLGPTVDLVRTAATRQSGFPRIALSGDRIVVAWTEVSDRPQVRVHDFDRALLRPPVAPHTNPATGAAQAVEMQWPAALTLPTPQGDELAFGDLGRPTLVHLWATWCAPCRAELPQLVGHQEQWAREGLRFIGLAVDDKAERVRSVMADAGAVWPTGLIDAGIAARHFGPGAVPRTLLFDGQGQLLWSHSGPIDVDPPGLQAAIDGLGAAPSP